MMKRCYFLALLCLILSPLFTYSQVFVHPGITHKKSDLDRMKYMIEARVDPWYSSYLKMTSDSKSKYDYVVQGNTSFTVVGRDDGTNYGAWNSDIRAAYYNAILWYVTGDTRHADKAVEIFNAWQNLTAVTSGGTDALSGGVGYIMIEAAEIIKSTYDGWSESDIQAFKDMLVYPGYSNTEVPSELSPTNGTFYWKSYQGDPGRHGNQGLSGWRTVMAMGIFLDNEIMYDRALRYVKGLPHRPDDLPYPSGPSSSTTLISSNEYYDSFNTSGGSSIEDYGYNEVMTNYIWENGQCQESSRDQQHTVFGIGLLTSMSEMTWNQGEDLYAHEDDRLLLGLEYNMRYNVSAIQSYPDQPSPWEPTVASGEFIERLDRTARWFSKAINPTGRGDYVGFRPVFEMAIGHFIGRGFKTEEEAKWIIRARDKSIELSGLEGPGHSNDAIGWGGLTARRPDGFYGDPIIGFDSNDLPNYSIHALPGTIEVEHYDHFVLEGEGRTYHDISATNAGGAYRIEEAVDIAEHSEGGYKLTSIETGEWLAYTVGVQEEGTFDISIKYASAMEGGTIKLQFDGEDITADVAIPFGNPNSTDLMDWMDFTIATGVELTRGAHKMKVVFDGVSESFELNSIDFEQTSIIVHCEDAITTPENLISGVNYSYYRGAWGAIPNFDNLVIIKNGVLTGFDLTPATDADNFAFQFDGYINIVNEGEYTFYTASDDGSNLYINDQLVVYNDGAHGVQESSGNICLEVGYHAIRVEYFEASGGNSLEVSWEGPDFDKMVISELQADSKQDQAITFEALPAKLLSDEDFSLVATASSGLPVYFTSSNDRIATIVEGNIHIVGTGTCTITAFQGGNDVYYSAPEAPQTLTINGLPQTITFDAIPDKEEGDDIFLLEATASSELPVSYTSSNTDVAAIISDSFVRIVGAGTTNITASQSGNDTYAAAGEVVQILTVNQQILGSEPFKNGVLLYPNPATDILVIESSSSIYNSFTIYNVNGRSVLSDTIDSSLENVKIDLRSLSKGIYMFRLQGLQSIEIFKLIKN